MELDSKLIPDEPENGVKRQNTTTNAVQQKPILSKTRQKLSTQSRVKAIHSPRARKSYALLIFMLIAGGTAVVLVSYQTAYKKDGTVVVTQAANSDSNGRYTMDNHEIEEKNPEQSTLTGDSNNDGDYGTENVSFRLKSSSETRHFERPESIGHMNVYIRKPTHERSKQPFKRFLFPVARYNRRRFPSASRFISFMPKISIFEDRLTQQTIIYSPIGGVYVLPPLINIYGQLFSVAKLISSGYASLVSSGIPPISAINMVPYFRPSPLTGPGIPKISPVTGGFVGGIRARYGSFSISKYRSPNMDDEDNYRSPPYSRNKWYRRRTKTPSRHTETYISPKPRALVSVDAISIVGVLFDDIPQKARDKAKILLEKKNDDYWRQLATQQMQYTQVRLIFRPAYYTDTPPPSKRGTLSLTLPKFFEIKFTTQPYFTTIDGHLLYVRNYTFHNVLITDVASLTESDDRLAVVDGSMVETFNLPVDPFLILQRTGFACMGEAMWPPYSIDPETTEYFYDDTCDVEQPQEKGLIGCQQCHCSYPLPTISCTDAVKEKIGHITFDLLFKRIADDPDLANQWRFPADGPSVNALGEVAPVNVFEYEEALNRLRFIYLYIETDGCELEEKCVGGTGWRRLMVFSTTAPNYGINDFDVGEVSYFATDQPSEYVTKYRIYEYSPCHQHFHFTHYAHFALKKRNLITYKKRGFCLQTTYRHANAEWSVMAQDHYVCSKQGIAPGWSDTYQGGLRCQWLDVTSINTSVRTSTEEFSSVVNPDGFLCEGTQINNTWLPTNFTTLCCDGAGCCGDSEKTKCCGGLPVQKQACKTWSDAAKDNTVKVTVTVPVDGDGQVTANCVDSSGKWGEKRDCGFRLHPKGKMLTCPTPGKSATLKSVTASTFFQVVRICEASIVLNSCLACIWNSSLTTTTIQHETSQDVDFMCTPQRDVREVGGKFCIYVAPLFEEMDHDPNFVRWS